MSAIEKLATILKADRSMLENLDRVMAAKTGKAGILDKVVEENKQRISSTLGALVVSEKSSSQIKGALRDKIISHEKQMRDLLHIAEGKDEFEKAAKLAQGIVKGGKGFFLKREHAKEILEKCQPHNLLNYLKLKNVNELFAKHDVAEAFSALRFIESDEWMHQTFEDAYSNFTADDFEERDIEIKVLGPEWQKVAQKFVAKKHHNVSHLKEFGVIFLNPIKMNIPGKLLRDFALLLHYFHEIEFYSKLFKIYSKSTNFAEKLKMLLRGDVPEVYRVEDGEWLIVQRYLFKENPKDPRLFMPRVNPESMHWARGERDLTLFNIPQVEFDLKLWCDLDWVGDVFSARGGSPPEADAPLEHASGGDGEGELISFDLEDNAMSFVSFMEGKEQTFNYHQREAMWTKIFSEYVGGEDNMERFLLANFETGIIKF